jgi:hypothetical protein
MEGDIMGRPKGSLNKKKSDIVMKKKRGRPKNVVEPMVEEEISKVTTAKFLGYCKCGSMISNPDLVSKFIFECPSCGNRAQIKVLAKDNGNTNKPMNKKEYLDGALNISYHQMSPLNDHQIDPDHLKIQDM